MKTIAEQYNWSENPTPITVEEIRKLAASHGNDMMVVIGINDREGIGISYNVVTVGKTAKFVNDVRDISTKMCESLGLKLKFGVELEDRRSEHTN
jgi:hypothetical protein